MDPQAVEARKILPGFLMAPSSLGQRRRLTSSPKQRKIIVEIEIDQLPDQLPQIALDIPLPKPLRVKKFQIASETTLFERPLLWRKVLRLVRWHIPWRDLAGMAAAPKTPLVCANPANVSDLEIEDTKREPAATVPAPPTPLRICAVAKTFITLF
jgi:hypothetical protein